MKIVLSTWGRFHFFHLARQFHKRDQLEAIFTTYPMFKLKDEDLPSRLIRSDAFLETLLLGSGRYGMINGKLRSDLTRLKVALHDRYMAPRVGDCDLFIALSGSGAKVGPAIQRRGGRYICERGSSHIAYGDDLMAEEFERWGAAYERTAPAFVDRERLEYEIADRIVVPSSFAKRSFVAMGVDADKISVNGYGAELSRFKPVAAPSTDEFVVLFVGGVRFRKGIPYLLEAFRRLRHPKKRLKIVGGMSAEIKEYLRSAPLDAVEFVGPVANTELPQLMSRAHVMVLPSLEEGMALVQAEAMACGCPVIGTTNTGGEDLFEDGKEGFIVPIRDPQAIADRLQELADDPDKRNRLGHAARERIKALGGWDSYGDRYEALCKALISGGGLTPGDGTRA